MDWTTLCVAFFGLLGVVASAYFSYLGQRFGKEINDAVNNRHKEHPKLYDLVVANHDKTKSLDERIGNIENRFATLPCSELIQSRNEGTEGN